MMRWISRDSTELGLRVVAEFVLLGLDPFTPPVPPLIVTLFDLPLLFESLGV